MNQIYAEHLLASHRQQLGESLNQYLRILEELLKDCEFKAVLAQENKKFYIRGAFIAGLCSNFIHQRPLDLKKV